MQHVEETTTFYTFQYGLVPDCYSSAGKQNLVTNMSMHPDDERYEDLNGDTFTAEWINGPVEATVIKDEAIDMSFGTGVMTITPWHDHTDFGKRRTPQPRRKEQIIDFHYVLMPIAGEFEGIQY